MTSDRNISDKNILDDFCERFCKIVEKHTKYIVVSGFVAISSGRTRGTEDIDMIIPKLTLAEFGQLHRDLIKNNFICVQDNGPEIIYKNYLTDGASVRYIQKDKLLPEMEIKFAKDALDYLQIKTRVKIPQTGLDVWFSSISMNIAFKEEYLKSDKDLADAKHLRIVFSELVNEKEINEIKKMIRQTRM